MRKLRDYEFDCERGASSWVLFVFESERREQCARDALAGVPKPPEAIERAARNSVRAWHHDGSRDV